MNARHAETLESVSVADLSAALLEDADVLADVWTLGATGWVAVGHYRRDTVTTVAYVGAHRPDPRTTSGTSCDCGRADASGTHLAHLLDYQD